MPVESTPMPTSVPMTCSEGTGSSHAQPKSRAAGAGMMAEAATAAAPRRAAAGAQAPAIDRGEAVGDGRADGGELRRQVTPAELAEQRRPHHDRDAGEAQQHAEELAGGELSSRLNTCTTSTVEEVASRR